MQEQPIQNIEGLYWRRLGNYLGRAYLVNQRVIS